MSEWVGKTEHAVFTLVNADGEPAAATVTWTITRPDATTLLPTTANPALGRYLASWQWDQVGEWTVYVAATGAVSADELRVLQVIASEPPEVRLIEACSPWTTVRDVRLACSSIALSGAASDEVVEGTIAVATDLLYVLSGRQFSGECSVPNVRPCSLNNCFGSAGHWQSLGGTPNTPDPSSYPPSPCGCSRVPTVDLGYWPVRSVDQVLIDGVVVDPTTYRLDNNRHLVRLADPTNDYINPGWPTCQAIDREATEPDTFEVSLTWGVGPPPAGVAAANHLACELAKMVATGVCNIPGRATSVNRQQISFTMINASMLENGLTGLWDVDAFIIAYNPDRRRGTTIVWSPDINVGTYRTGQ